MKRKLLFIFAACMALTACASTMSGEKIEVKDISEYEASTSDDDDDDEPDRAEEGKKAPDITITKFDGIEAMLSDYYDKPTIVEFWATWCTYCKKELPALEMLKETYGDDINIIALNCSDSAEDAEEFWNESSYTFEAAMVSDDDSYKYAPSGIPVTVIIDTDGIVQMYLTGSTDAETMYNDYFVPVFDEIFEDTEE
ncbi:MAG: TlpA family protein disulfide reductase [Clostridiales bacterium]|nr:TlpA family protein disulfide reductase [Clostridiales bacterium]